MDQSPYPNSLWAAALDNRGAVAQLGERFNGIEEVRGSSPLSSTKPFYLCHFYLWFFAYVLCSEKNGRYYIVATEDVTQRLA